MISKAASFDGLFDGKCEWEKYLSINIKFLEDQLIIEWE
tara:strand:+ start:1799 stop:1915 length:117 start_codon:yes stop_codon:yes gene_type:complete